MKLYYFVIIAIGLMFTFHLAGIETGSGRILDMLTSENVSNTIVDYDEADYTGADTGDILNNNSWWVVLAVAFTTLIALAGFRGIRVAGFGLEVNPMNAIVAAVASAIFTMFALDFFSILIHMHEITGGTGWQYHLTWILIVPILFGFALSLIQFIKGTE